MRRAIEQLKLANQLEGCTDCDAMKENKKPEKKNKL